MIDAIIFGILFGAVCVGVLVIMRLIINKGKWKP